LAFAFALVDDSSSVDRSAGTEVTGVTLSEEVK
jgi:hypothetical protein